MLIVTFPQRLFLRPQGVQLVCAVMASRPYRMRARMGSSRQRRYSEEPEQLMLRPHQQHSVASPGSSAVVMQPLYAPSQSGNEGPGSPIGQRTSSQMLPIAPDNSLATGLDADRPRPVRCSLRNRTPDSGPSKSRRVSGSATPVSTRSKTRGRSPSGSGHFVDRHRPGAYGYDEGGSYDSESRSRRSQGINRAHTSIMKTARTLPRHTYHKTYVCNAGCDDSSYDSSDSNEEEMEGGYSWSMRDRNKTNNNAKDRTCHHHANRHPGSVSMLVARKPEKTLYDKIMSPTFSPRRSNVNNANNKTTKRGKSKQRLQRLQRHADPIVNEARRIGAQLAMVGLSKDSPQLNKNLRVTGAMKAEWDDEPTTSGHGQVSFDTDNGYNGDSAGWQSRSFAPARTTGKNQRRTPAKQANRSSNSCYNFRTYASKTPPFDQDSGGDIDDDIIMDFNNSAEYQNEPIKYVPDLGPAQRINRREPSASRTLKLIQLEGSPPPETGVVQQDVDTQIQTAYAMQTAVFITAACYSLHLSCLGVSTLL